MLNIDGFYKGGHFAWEIVTPGVLRRLRGRFSLRRLTEVMAENRKCYSCWMSRRMLPICSLR
jgi:hypothetical protein